MKMGELVKKFRKERGLTQQQLAEFAKVPFSTVNKLENNDANVTMKTLERILNIFNCQLSVSKKNMAQDR